MEVPPEAARWSPAQRALFRFAFVCPALERGFHWTDEKPFDR